MTLLHKFSFLLAGIFVFLTGGNLLFAQWAAPIDTPSATNNVAAPINTSVTDQVKTGGLSVDTLSVVGNAYIQGGDTGATPSGNLDLEVEGTVGAFEFCDESGNNCFSAAAARSAIDGGYTTYTVLDKGYYWGAETDFFGPDSNNRKSFATARCNPEDKAIKRRAWGLNNSRISKTNLLNLYNTMDSSVLDAKGAVWESILDDQHYAYRKSYNGIDRLWGAKHGSIAVAEVLCADVNVAL